MTELDERIRFYLRNQAQIDEWADLRKEATQGLDEFLRSLIEDAATVAGQLELDADPSDCAVTSGGVVLLRRGSWPLDENGQPLIGVGFAWESKAFLAGPTAPYSGLRISPDHSDRRRLRDFVRESCDSVRESFGYRHRPIWFANRPMAATGDYWEDLEPFRLQAAIQLAEEWERFADGIDLAVAGWAASS